METERYTKLDAQGNALPDSALSWGASWSMVKDNVTGFIWEMKTDNGSIHDKNNEYTWSDVQGVFIAILNIENFGGFSDWRRPTIQELQSLIDYTRYNPTINTDYFPNTMSSVYWSSDTVSDTNNVRCVGFGSGYLYSNDKSHSYYVRAVRGGQ